MNFAIKWEPKTIWNPQHYYTGGPEYRHIVDFLNYPGFDEMFCEISCSAISSELRTKVLLD